MGKISYLQNYNKRSKINGNSLKWNTNQDKNLIMLMVFLNYQMIAYQKEVEGYLQYTIK